jgi:hypothetical protein
MSIEYKYGDLGVITELTKAKGLNEGKGYSRSYVEKVLNGDRTNEAIMTLATNYLKAKEQAFEQLQKAS